METKPTTTSKPTTTTTTTTSSMSATVGLFIMNCLDDGWKVSKKENNYIFTKKHENRREVFQDNYLDTFLEKGVCCKKNNCCNCIFEVDLSRMPDDNSDIILCTDDLKMRRQH